MNKLPSPSELAEKTGLGYWGACRRLSQFRHGRISIAELFQPARTKRFTGHAKRMDGVTAQEIVDRVPGLSLGAAMKRIRGYENGTRDFESLFHPKGHTPPSAGTAEWRSLGKKERLENMPVLGSWEQQLEGTR